LWVAVAARFDCFARCDVYHCHVLEHESHDIMRFHNVLPPEIDDILKRDMPMT